MSLEEPFQLKHTNVSRPQLAHQESKQSIAASEDYYSFSEHGSSSSDDRSKPTPHRYTTPPSRHRSPAQSHEQLQSEATLPSLKGVGKIRQHPQQATVVPHTPIPEEEPQRDSKFSQERPPMDSEELSTTPGMDETPYIRFAIDQLTRDEEVRGSRQYPQGNAAFDYPVERTVPDDGLGYMQKEQEMQRRLARKPPPRPPRNDPVQPSDSGVQRDTFVLYRPSRDSLQHPRLNFIPSILRPLWLGIFAFHVLAMLAALIFCAIYSNQHQGLWDYTGFGNTRYFVFEYLPTLVGTILLLWVFQIQIALQRIIPFISMASESPSQRSEAVFLELYPTQFLLPRLEHFRADQPLVGICYIIFWLFIWTIPLLASAFNVRFNTDSGNWRWIAVQGVIWTAIVLYILLILALLLLFVIVRKPTGLKWDPRSLADIIALLERSNIMGDYSGSETFTKTEFRERLDNRADRLAYWTTTRRPNDVFYGIGEEGASPRRYSIEAGRIREKGPERVFPDSSGNLPGQRDGDFIIRMDIRNPVVRLKYVPWYLKDGAVIAWIVIGVVLLIAFLVVSYINHAVHNGFLPSFSARANSAGFSSSNFFYSFVPALIATVLFLSILSFDYTFRTLQPYIALSTAGGADASTSLLADYAARLPVSATFSALENRHFQTAFLSFVSLVSLITLPTLAGGCFWTQFYANNTTVRVSAHLPAYYALCFFLALYTVSLFVLLPNRRRAALPHRAGSLAETISWVYQSQILADRAFSRVQTKPELVAKLMGTAYLERPWTRSITNLVRSSKDDLQATDDSAHGTSAAFTEKTKGKEKVSLRENEDAKRASVLHPGSIRYGFGIHVGRDGLEHLGIDRVRRGGERSGRELVIWEEQRRRSFAGSA